MYPASYTFRQNSPTPFGGRAPRLYHSPARQLLPCPAIPTTAAIVLPAVIAFPNSFNSSSRPANGSETFTPPTGGSDSFGHKASTSSAGCSVFSTTILSTFNMSRPALNASLSAFNTSPSVFIMSSPASSCSTLDCPVATEPPAVMVFCFSSLFFLLAR
ncbi:hypothetical protein ES703_53258 [subsurface metagenome]